MNDEHWEHWEAPSASLPDTYFTAYDKLTFPRKVAERMVINAKLNPGQRVLDIACGTGWTTIAAAMAVGVDGKVIGIDIEKNWLDIAIWLDSENVEITGAIPTENVVIANNPSAL